MKPINRTRWSQGGQEGRCDMAKPRKRKDYTPVTVPFAATQTGETPEISAWAHSAVWTDRMLDTLHVGVRGGKWHTLIDKVFDKRNLYASARKVLGKKGAAGVDHQSVEDFSADALAELDRLHEQLRGDLYRPLAVRRTWIPKPGSNEKRPLGIPTVRDRVVQTALVHVIEPIFDHTFHRAQLRLPTRPQLSSSFGSCGRTSCGRECLCGRCRFEELLRHDPERSADGDGRVQGVGSSNS